MAPIGPFKLLTVNSAPGRAERLVGQVIDRLKDDYALVHVANAPSIECVQHFCEEFHPDIVVIASVWSSEESVKASNAAQQTKKSVKVLAFPEGLQVEHGPNAVVEYAIEHLPALLVEKSLECE